MTKGVRVDPHSPAWNIHKYRGGTMGPTTQSPSIPIVAYMVFNYTAVINYAIDSRIEWCGNKRAE